MNNSFGLDRRRARTKIKMALMRLLPITFVILAVIFLVKVQLRFREGGRPLEILDAVFDWELVFKRDLMEMDAFRRLTKQVVS